MNSTTLLYSKINSLPQPLQMEVEDFVDFLFQKVNDKKRPINKPTSKKKHLRKAGFLKGTFIMKEGFDDPLECFKDYM